MTNAIFGAFLERMTESINCEMGDPKSFKNEYFKLLDKLINQPFKPIKLLRELGHFRIELAHLKSYLFDEKKVYLVANKATYAL